MAWNSWPVPRSVSAPVNWTTWITATSHAANAVVMNSAILTRRVGTPTFRAASTAPPVPKIQFPARVRSRTHVASAVRPNHHRIATLNWLPNRFRLLAKIFWASP